MPSTNPVFYNSPAWKKLRQRNFANSILCCAMCGKDVSGKGEAQTDHIRERRDHPVLALVPANLRILCHSCHNLRHGPDKAKRMRRNGSVRPEWLRVPRCRIVLVCGPPAAGKSTYVRDHATPSDSVIDFDAIAMELGFPDMGNMRGCDIGAVLYERNRRLAKLEYRKPSHVAWVIVSGAAPSLRAWWINKLGVDAGDVVLLKPDKHVVEARIKADPNRSLNAERQIAIAREWYRSEQYDEPSPIRRGCDEEGNPTDPLHAWNRCRKDSPVDCTADDTPYWGGRVRNKGGSPDTVHRGLFSASNCAGEL
jgi:hypothetical protein